MVKLIDHTLALVLYFCLSMYVRDSDQQTSQPPMYMDPESNLIVGEEITCDLCSNRNGSGLCTDESNVRTDFASCRCDIACTTFGDCCKDRLTTNCLRGRSSLLDVKSDMWECRGLYIDQTMQPANGESYWMISKCPVEWLSLNKTDSMGQLSVQIAENCINNSLTLPPVSDSLTGRVYRNEYCALCNAVRSAVNWRFVAVCDVQLESFSNPNLTLEFLQEHCHTCKYAVPGSFYENPELIEQPRACIKNIISTCPSYNSYLASGYSFLTAAFFAEAAIGCASGPLNTVSSFPLLQNQTDVYKNINCALCNGVDPLVEIICFTIPIPMNNICRLLPTTTGTPLNLQNSNQNPSFSLFLDLLGDGSIAITHDESTLSIVESTCSRNQVFDPVSDRCRDLVCPPGYTVSGATCTSSIPTRILVFPGEDDDNNIRPIAGGDDNNNFMPIDETGNDNVVSIPEPDSATESSLAGFDVLNNCSLLSPDNDTMFIDLGNGSVLFEGRVFPIIDTNAENSPIICVPTVSTNQTESVSFKYIFKFVSIVPSLLPSLCVFVTHIIFPKIHSLFGLVMINLSGSFFLSDVFLLVRVSLSDSNLCLPISLLWQLFSLASFSWLCILSVDVCLILLKRELSSTKKKVSLAFMYEIIGWGLPTAIVLGDFLFGTMFTLDSEGTCVFKGMALIIVLIVLPISLAVIFNIVAVVYMFKIHSKNHRDFQKQHKHKTRVYVTSVFVMAAAWIFGFIYLLSSNTIIISVAHYGFLILNTSRAFVLLICLVYNHEVRGLCLTILSPSCCSAPSNKIVPLTGPQTTAVNGSLIIPKIVVIKDTPSTELPPLSATQSNGQELIHQSVKLSSTLLSPSLVLACKSQSRPSIAWSYGSGTNIQANE